MKHLKAYGSRRSRRSKNPWIILPDDIIQELKDISLELTDVGFNVEIKFDEISTVCFINRFNKNFILTEVITEVIKRIDDYLSSKGYNIDIYWTDADWMSNDSDDDILVMGHEYSNIWIRFQKK